MSKKANHIILNNKTILDLRQDSVAPENLLTGATAHDKSGQVIEGIAISPAGEITIIANGSYDIANYATAVINVPKETMEFYDGLVIITRQEPEEEPLDPEFNHYGIIPEGASYMLYNANTGEEEEYNPGDVFPDININGDHIYCYPGLLVYVYNSENNTWAANDHGTTIEDNVIFLESINGAPMTAINSTFQQTGIEDVEDATRLREDITHVTIPKSVTFIAVWAFYNCSNLANITYTGTMEQWNSIELEDKWNRHCPEITVTCTDGTITIPAYGS